MARRLAVLVVTAPVPKARAALKAIAAARRAPAISKVVHVASKVPVPTVKVRVDSKIKRSPRPAARSRARPKASPSA